MLYFLSQWTDWFTPFNLFQYITFRSGGAFLTSLGLCLALGGPFVRALKRWRMEQFVRECGPHTHLKKSGTPTMGGLLIIGTLLASTLLWARPDNRFVWLLMIGAVYLALVGFLDDYWKWVRRASGEGMSQRTKMGALVLWGLAVGAYLYVAPPNDALAHRVFIPYLKDVSIPLGGLSAALTLMVIVGSANAVNLTDGLDGLAAGTLVVSALAFAVFAYLAGHAALAAYLRMVPVPGAGEMCVVMAALGGACLGFLWFNSHPAEMFMGDTGSLPLGGLVGMTAVCLQQELILVVVGGVFVAEAMSVLLQAGSYRLRKGRRLFRMAPLHHHYEMKGLAETKVTIRFWIMAIVLALVAMSSIKIR